ncbi:MAG: prepilin-type N-terminal cleavage/methylation domain-containing protein [Pseudomonadota bacterium]|nr:prepilin-type N-terminal cleavage/methylation domain-containing protein [Pseudomonadota bacterium]
MKHRICRNNNLFGFSLIEVMVASSIGLIAMLGIGQLIITQFRAVNAVRLAGEANNLVTLARMVLGNQKSCTLNISNFSGSQIQPPLGGLTMTMARIVDQGGVVMPVIIPPALPTNPGISVWVSNISLSGFELSDADNFIYRANMLVTITKRGVVMGGSQTRQPIAMQFQTDPTGTIIECAAGTLVPVIPASTGGPGGLSDLQVEQMCLALGGTYSAPNCALPTGPAGAGGADINQTATCSATDAGGAISATGIATRTLRGGTLPANFSTRISMTWNTRTYSGSGVLSAAAAFFKFSSVASSTAAGITVNLGYLARGTCSGPWR